MIHTFIYVCLDMDPFLPSRFLFHPFSMDGMRWDEMGWDEMGWDEMDDMHSFFPFYPKDSYPGTSPYEREKESPFEPEADPLGSIASVDFAGWHRRCARGRRRRCECRAFGSEVEGKRRFGRQGGRGRIEGGTPRSWPNPGPDRRACNTCG